MDWTSIHTIAATDGQCRNTGTMCCDGRKSVVSVVGMRFRSPVICTVHGTLPVPLYTHIHADARRACATDLLLEYVRERIHHYHVFGSQICRSQARRRGQYCTSRPEGRGRKVGSGRQHWCVGRSLRLERRRRSLGGTQNYQDFGGTVPYRTSLHQGLFDSL